jgi:tRNA nucleotidyltransferase (CCA-adding enzyme)
MERVRVELDKMLAGPDPFHALELLLDSKLLLHLKSEIHLPLVKWQSADLPPSLARLKELEDPLLRWVMLFKSMHITSDIVSRALRRLTFSSRNNKAVALVLKLHEWLHEQVDLAVLEKDKPAKVEAVSLAEARVTLERPDLIWKRAAVQFGKETMLNWLHVMQLEQIDVDIDMQESKSAVLASFLEKGEEWLSEMRVETLADLDIDGSDLIVQFGLPAGPWVSEMLHRLLLDTAFGNARNQKNLLLERAKIYRKELNKQ